MVDAEAILALHQEAFADKFYAAFGKKGIAKGSKALLLLWQSQGEQALRGMFVAEWQQQIIGTTTLRTWEMNNETTFLGDTRLALQQILGFWGTIRAILALSLLNHQVKRSEGFITDVAVLTPFRRSGLATTLLAFAAQEAILLQKSYLGLYVSSSNTGAYALYRHLGFYKRRTRRSWLTQLFLEQREWAYMCKDLS